MELSMGMGVGSWRRQRWLAPQPTLTDVRARTMPNAMQANAISERASEESDERNTSCWGGTVEAEDSQRVRASSPKELTCLGSAESEGRAGELASLDTDASLAGRGKKRQQGENQAGQ
jgi:hypothetical protein